MKPLAYLIGAAFIVAGTTFTSAEPIQATSALKASDSVLCGKRDQIVRALSEKFSETQQAVGVVDENAIMEIFVSATGSWTILATGPDGNSCLMGTGEGWDSKILVAGVDS